MVKKWTAEEIDFLKNNCWKMTYKQIGSTLGRNKNSVKAKARQLSIKKRTKKTQPYGYWTKDRIIKRLGDLAKEHGESYLRPSNLREKESDLFNAIWRTFRSFETATKDAGYNYEEIIGKKPHGYWTKEKVIERLRILATKHGKCYLNPSDLKKNESALVNASVWTFGSLKSAVETAGYSYEQLQKPKTSSLYWTREKVINKLRVLAKEHGESYLSSSNLQKKEGYLFYGITKTFGSLNVAVTEAGYDYEKIRKQRPSGYWTEEKILERIRMFAAEHGEIYLRPSNLKKNESSLLGVATKKFGSFKTAAEKAGFDYEKILGVKPQGYWTKEKVIERLRMLADKHGESYLSSSNLQKKEGNLFDALIKTFGSLNVAVTEAGYDYEKIRKRRPSGYWTEKKILERIRMLAAEHGESYLRPINLRENESDLLTAVTKKFGSLKAATEKAGFDYEKILGMKPHGYWTKEKVIERIRELADTYGLGYLHPANLHKKEAGLLTVATKTFGSFHKALQEAGFNHEEIYMKRELGYWTEDRVIKKIIDLARKHGESYLRSSNLAKKEGGLLHASEKIFGSLRGAVEKAGLDYYKITKAKRGYWTKDRIIKRLGDLAKEHGEIYLRPSNLREKENDLSNAIWRTFRSFKIPIEEAGIDYKKIRGAMFGDPIVWKAWEICCKEMAEEFFEPNNVRFKKKLKGTQFCPDLQIPSKKLIIDAKTNTWDKSGIDRDLDNYIDYCEKLEFWCLEGSRKMSSDIVTIVNAKGLLKRLKDIGVEENTIEEFRKKIGLLKKGIDPYEGSQKEISAYVS